MDVARTAIVKASLTGDTALLTEAARVVAGQGQIMPAVLIVLPV